MAMDFCGPNIQEINLQSHYVNMVMDGNRQVRQCFSCSGSNHSTPTCPHHRRTLEIDAMADYELPTHTNLSTEHENQDNTMNTDIDDTNMDTADTSMDSSLWSTNESMITTSQSSTTLPLTHTSSTPNAPPDNVDNDEDFSNVWLELAPHMRNHANR